MLNTTCPVLTSVSTCACASASALTVGASSCAAMAVRCGAGGFGLGFSVVKSAVEAGLHGSTGNFAWGGAASTIFWCDPVEDLSVVFFTQVMGMQPRNMLRAKIGSMVSETARLPACTG